MKQYQWGEVKARARMTKEQRRVMRMAVERDLKKAIRERTGKKRVSKKAWREWCKLWKPRIHLIQRASHKAWGQAQSKAERRLQRDMATAHGKKIKPSYQQSWEYMH